MLWRLLLLLYGVVSFNLDVYSPIYKLGLNNTYFGYSVAQHFNGETALILVGAPKAESGQMGTHRAGALFSCPLSTVRSGQGACSQIRAEYEDVSAYSKSPEMTNVMGKQIHPLGKDGELLGASVSSQGRINGSAVVCAPLIRFHNTSAYAQGSCYELNSDLTFRSMISTCMQKNLPRTERHNEYGACMEGISVTLSGNSLVTGVIGAKKWTGGVFAKMSEGGLFGKSQEKYTMAHQDGGIRSLLTSHDYLGYSVAIGRFGFWYETEDGAQTVVSGATRSGQHGSVVFLPFTWENGDHLSLTDDRFVLNGTRMGSAFGYSLAVLDINNDGFDDLVVGAPFEHRTDEDGHFGGIVYVYFSKGSRKGRKESDQVFHRPIVLKAPRYFSEFGLSITALGNIDGDRAGYQDFAIGAPYAEHGGTPPPRQPYA